MWIKVPSAFRLLLASQMMNMVTTFKKTYYNFLYIVPIPYYSVSTMFINLE